jgi:hypothetical protein
MSNGKRKPKYVMLHDLRPPSPLEGQRCIVVTKTGRTFRLPSASADALSEQIRCPHCDKPVPPPCRGVSHSQHKQQQVALKLTHAPPSRAFIAVVVTLALVGSALGYVDFKIETAAADRRVSSGFPSKN